ncbi:MAG: DUF934 domain-containing protein [Ahrensia sp.]|nr:DUF934 domain-containing protein [Ahrensia sp.]
MTTIVKNGRFLDHDPLALSFKTLEDGKTDAALDLSSDVDPVEIWHRVRWAPALRIHFPSSADGRGFSIAQALRKAGYRGHLRAFGHVLADQYPLALRSGFDDVEISDELAARQPEHQWSDAYGRIQGGYLERLQAGVKRAA